MASSETLLGCPNAIAKSLQFVRSANRAPGSVCFHEKAGLCQARSLPASSRFPFAKLVASSPRFHSHFR